MLGGSYAAVRQTPPVFLDHPRAESGCLSIEKEWPVSICWNGSLGDRKQGVGYSEGQFDELTVSKGSLAVARFSYLSERIG